MENRTLEVNGRKYNASDAPIVVVCVDGSEPDYMDRAIEGGHMPWLAEVREIRDQSNRGLRGADLHKSQQPIHRHRDAAIRAWYCR